MQWRMYDELLSCALQYMEAWHITLNAVPEKQPIKGPELAGLNRCYTLCSPEFLALGGGRHFALYLDSDLLIGSSTASETYGNPCLVLSEDFKVKDVELWGFAYASTYEDVLALRQNEPPGICRW